MVLIICLIHLLNYCTTNYPLEHMQDSDQDDQDEDEENATLQYKQLIAIHAGKPKGGLDMWHIDPMKVRRLSLSEQQLENAAKTRGTDIVR